MVPARSFVTNAGPARTRPKPLDFSTTAEYHHSLRDQTRQPDVGSDLDGQQLRDRTPPRAVARRWMPARPKTSDSSTRGTTKSSKKRDASIHPLSPLSRQEVEEFETLPIAIRRKVRWHFSFSYLVVLSRDPAVASPCHAHEGTLLMSCDKTCFYIRFGAMVIEFWKLHHQNVNEKAMLCLTRGPTYDAERGAVGKDATVPHWLATNSCWAGQSSGMPRGCSWNRVPCAPPLRYAVF
jgi:hypothetical protein